MTTRPDPSRSGNAGFTLIEVVLALVILSFVALMLYAAFEVGHRAVVAGERQADDSQRMRLAEEIVGRQVRSTVFYFARHDDDVFPYFIGRADGMTFVTSAPQGRGGTGLAVVNYRVFEGQLILEERVAFTPDDLYDPPSDAPVKRAVLMTGITRLLFEYLARDDTEANWQRVWDAQEEDTLPAAVRISIEGIPFFDGVPWTTVVPLMTIASGWGTDEYQEPPDEDDHYEDDDEEEDDADDNDDDLDDQEDDDA